MNDLLKGLNAQQKEAVTAPLKPVCVLAGAGSGKTTVLTRRIAWLIQQEGIAPGQILAVTFTKKAAEEMAERVRKYLPAGTVSPHLSTFHSLGYLILRQEIDDVEELQDGFGIIDNYQQKAYVQAAMRENGYDPDHERTGAYMGRINEWKGKQLTAAEAVKKIPHKQDKEKYFLVYATYEKMLRDDNKADFADLLFLTAQLFDRHPEIVEKYRKIYPYILVDEYQDTSPLQYKILFDLASESDNLYVVGDNDQAIYGFRGADMTIILNFQRDFADAKIITLEKNYRSYPKIIEAANGVIANNKERFDKKLVSTRRSKALIEAHQAYDPEQEAAWLTEQIGEAVQSGKRKYSDFTVLVRNNALTAPVETALSHAHIPYTVVGGKSFFERMEVLDIIAYMKFILDPNDWQAFSRIANKPARRFAKASLRKLKNEIDRGSVTLVEFLESVGDSYRHGSRGGYGKLRIGQMYHNSDRLRMNPDASIAEIIQTILADEESNGLGYESFLKNMAEPVEMTTIREDNIYCLLAMARPNERLAHFLARFDRIKRLARTDLSELNSVKLMTIHGAKGLEFPVVYIVGAEERIIPSWHCGDNETLIEEERRVFYVAMTRARDELHISSCYKRQVRGNVEMRDPSRFALEIPADAYSGSWVMSEMEREQCEVEWEE